MWPNRPQSLEHTYLKYTLTIGTQGRKNKVLKRLTDFSGSNKVPTMDKLPLDKSPPSEKQHIKII